MIKNQNFGVEIELTGITRQQAAGIIANYFGTTFRYIGTYYKTWGATDRKNRTCLARAFTTSNKRWLAISSVRN